MSPPVCANCGAPSATLKKCSGCQQVSYCNQSCQKAHWKTHKRACAPTSSFKPSNAFDLVWEAREDDPASFHNAYAALGGKMTIPRSCVEPKRLANGEVVPTVNEKKYQEWTKKKAEEIAAKKAKKGPEQPEDGATGEKDGHDVKAV